MTRALATLQFSRTSELSDLGDQSGQTAGSAGTHRVLSATRGAAAVALMVLPVRLR